MRKRTLHPCSISSPFQRSRLICDSFRQTTMSPPTNPNFDFYEHSSPPDLVWLPATPPLSSCGESHECHDDENDERRLSAFIW
jgi:hypothetical protein